VPAQILSKAVGIDLGTTNSAVAVMNPTDTDIVIHRDTVAKAETTPSCVWKDPRTGDIIVGRTALRRVGTMPQPIRSIKRLMGQQATVRLTDQAVTPEFVSAAILAEMKRQIEEDVAKFGTGDTAWIVDRAIVTVPAYFDQPQIDATRRAGEMAGLQVLDLLHEPTAAACYHCWRTRTQDGVFLVYDLGGGTFDVTVLRCTRGTFEVLGISGNTRLGGDDLDVAIAEHLRERLAADGWAVDLDLAGDPEDRLRFEKLKFLAESVKKSLSLASEFHLSNTGMLQDKAGNPVIVDTMFERPDIEAIMRPLVERTIPYCHEALAHAERKGGVKLADVDHVILAGGSTHVPMVRELVQQAFCAVAGAKEPRAKCAEPIYEKVDTLVALGAAVRAAAVGGLAVFNTERTVRVSFRGTGATGARETYVGGHVESLAPGVSLGGGRVRLLTADFEDEAELGDAGSFRFTEVPLQQGAENLLTFEVYDRGGALVATAGRPVTQSRDAASRPTGGGSSTAALPKALSLMVNRGGKEVLRELIPALASLPTEADYTFMHPGQTEAVRFPLYQQRRKIQEIAVHVPSTTPEGTPIKLNVRVDQLSFITVKGTIGETVFETAIEPPPDRKLPPPAEVESLARAFQEALAYLPAGKRATAQVKWKRAKDAFDAARARGDEAQAVHEFEEMEEIVASIARTESPLDPPKEAFDELVQACYELNRYVAPLAEKKGQPHDARETERNIDAQRQQGEKAYRDGDQTAWGDVIQMLESIRQHLIGFARKVVDDPRTPEQKVRDAVKHVAGEAEKVANLAAARDRRDLQAEAEQIRARLAALLAEAGANPDGVRDKLQREYGRLEQMMDLLMERAPRAAGGKLAIEVELGGSGGRLDRQA
jgi:molecular chaperone DnaK